MTLNRYNPQVAGKTGREVWVCDACKKVNNDLILMGKWKLIDRCCDCAIQCDICAGNTAAVANPNLGRERENLTW